MLAKKPSATAENIKIPNIFRTPTTLFSCINFTGTKVNAQKNINVKILVFKTFKYYHKIVKYLKNKISQ